MLGYISFIVSIVGAVPYLLATVRGSVKPERTTWGIWTLILLLSVIAYRAEGASDSLWFLVGDLVVTTLIFLVSLWKGKGGYGKLDITCIGVALLGLLVWLLSGQPFAQLLGVMTADVIAVIPTIRSAFQKPSDESASTYAASALAALMGVFAVGTWDSILIAYPLYLYTANLLAAIVIITAKHLGAESHHED